MKRIITFMLCISILFCGAKGIEKPWKHGGLKVSDVGPYLSHADGTPFFWLGDTGWLLPQRLDRDEAAYYLKRCGEAGYNVVQIQVINGIPAFNVYGQMSMPDGFDFSNINRPGVYGYWDHMDYIIDMAERNGIYIGMVCIWGGMVKAGMMDEQQAVAYGTFLANRYKDKPNVIWIMGGDVQGNIRPEVWDSLARTIRSIDKNHVMTYHPRGRHTSAQWFADREWLDFHMFQSGHRRYNQRMGNKNYPIQEGTEEDSWMYVDSTRVYDPVRPVLDGEPSYEDIPQGLHGADEPRWSARDVRRYAYWSVFAGSCGHTYGHNSIMQFVRPGVNGAYFADGIAKPWYKALDDDGFNQMVHLKRLMLAFPYYERVPDRSVIRDNGERYERLIATRGKDYLLVYNHTGRDMNVDLSKISGRKHRAWWMDAASGAVKYIGEVGKDMRYKPDGDADGVLIVTDVKSAYLTPETTSLMSLPQPEVRDLTE